METKYGNIPPEYAPTGIPYIKTPPKTLGEYVKQIDERVKRLEENFKSTKPYVYPR